MELKKCESCEKVFLGERNLRLCPICTVAKKGKEVARRRQAELAANRPVAVASR
jgi:rubrerythrin